MQSTCVLLKEKETEGFERKACATKRETERGEKKPDATAAFSMKNAPCQNKDEEIDGEIYAETSLNTGRGERQQQQHE